jgi:hypothetical protein
LVGLVCSGRGFVIFTYFALGPHPQRLPALAHSLAPVVRGD